MNPDKVLRSLPRRFDIKFPPVMKRKISPERIFRLDAMELIYVFLALAV